MTIDEEIYKLEEKSMNYKSMGNKLSMNMSAEQQQRASEYYYMSDYYLQLAEWLKELKAYKDFEDKGYIMCRFEVVQDDRHRTTKMVLDFSTKELFDSIVEVNADE